MDARAAKRRACAEVAAIIDTYLNAKVEPLDGESEADFRRVVRGLDELAQELVGRAGDQWPFG